MLSDFFYEWKVESSIAKAENQVENIVHESRKAAFL